MSRGQGHLVWKGEYTEKALTMEDNVTCELALAGVAERMEGSRLGLLWDF